MIVPLVFIVCALLGNIQGAINVFNPSNFTEESYSGTRDWTMWFNVGKPKKATSGDSEDVRIILAENPKAWCRIPFAIEAQSTIEQLVGQFSGNGSDRTTHSIFYQSIRLHLVVSIFTFHAVAQQVHLL